MSDIRCSFCSIEARAMVDKLMIAGPHTIYICSDCVALCADVLVEKKANDLLKVVGEEVDLIARLTRERDSAVDRARTLEFELSLIARSVARVSPAPHAVRCMWCDLALDGEAAARAHVATCEKHPAVIELRRQQPRRRTARRAK
jgi:hypothetical protein